MAMVMAGITTSNIAVTMSIDVRRYSVSVAVLGVGLALIGLSLPRMIAYSYLATVPSDVSDALKSGRSMVSGG